MEGERSKAAHWLNLIFTEPYYMYHFLAFFSYFVIRTSSVSVLSPTFANRLIYREIQAVLAFGVLTAIKMVREETWEGFIGDTLFFAKIFLVPLALMMDYNLALWYIVAFSVMYILTQQPAFQGSGTSSKLTPLQLEALLTEGNTSRFWLVELRSSYSSDCIRTSRFFPELSITYSNKNLSFAMVDLGVFPNAAEKFGLFLGSMDQLPTYILFENATAVARFPDFVLEHKGYHPTITKRFLSRYFELDRRLLEYVNGK
ncbi:hypothetical protein CsatB_007606 [Cannabis sativa]|uniref:Thioredoxin-related transmembrane protein 2 n=2 Tax=Cannabis sativa TaxID=3483 RepID=A0AB40ECT9_CANSA|nr:uncharacterized protein LOC115705877 [Cannabis sativa]KAF4363253.1 hypothetical protein G4B88_016007 [Cannabis sativa]